MRIPGNISVVMGKNDDKKKKRIKKRQHGDHVDYIIYQEKEEKPDKKKMSFTGYALVKYSALVIITIAILYFIAVFLLPLIKAFLGG